MPDLGPGLAAAQLRCTPGDVAANLTAHGEALELAAAGRVGVLVFPELSVTGYTLHGAADLQQPVETPLLDELEDQARAAGMLVLVGLPLRADAGRPFLGAVALGGMTRRAYAKIHVHDSEAPYFQPGSEHAVWGHGGAAIGCAICADLNHREHAAATRAAGAGIYGVGALVDGAAFPREEPLLRSYAADLGLTVVFANHAAPQEGYAPVGRSGIWAPGGGLVVQAVGAAPSLVMARQTGQGWRGDVCPL